MIGHRLMGMSLLHTGESRKAERISIRRSHFTILRSIVRWRRGLAKTSEWQSCPIGHWLCGCLAIPRPRSRTPSRALKDAREHRPSRHFDVCTVIAALILTSSAEITRRQPRYVDELIALADEKGYAVLEGWRHDANEVAYWP